MHRSSGSLFRAASGSLFRVERRIAEGSSSRWQSSASASEKAFLVTGCQGFVGAYVLKQLLEMGHRVVGCDVSPSDGILEQVLTPAQFTSVASSRVFGDIADPVFVRQTVAAADPTHIIHLAGLQIPTCRV